MSKNKLRTLMMLYGAMAMMDPNTSEKRELTERELKELEQIKEEKYHQRMLQKGLSKFYYGENYLYALNQKSANKKAKKRGWI